jgi:glutathione synthase/RimK-type ligase-like ATP-grasp enzyme
MSTRKKVLILPALNVMKEVAKKYSDDHDFTFAKYSELEINFNQTGVKIFHKGVDIRDYDKVWLSSAWSTRDVAYAIGLYLDANNVSHTFSEESSSKVTDQMKLALAGLRSPNTWYSTKRKLASFMDSIERVCNYPMVIKDTAGSRGRYASFISDGNDLISTSLSLPNTKNYLIQEFIPNDYEWGVLVANGHIVSAERSYPKVGEYRNNCCKGATEVFTNVKDIPEEIQDIVVKSAKALGLSWCRVDVLEDKNTGVPYVLEVNRFPGITLKSEEVIGAEKFLLSVLES